MAERFADVPALVEALRPEQPVFCVRPHVIAAAARRFLDHFPGRVLYAVKCNPEAAFIGPLCEAGIADFDVASLAEVELVAKLNPPGRGYFMHPVKSRHDIRVAYREHGIRYFVVDHQDELEKLRTETGGATDVIAMVRLATRAGAAVYDLGGKFGASQDDTVALLRTASSFGWKVGISFHVGSQCLDPRPYVDALRLVAAVKRRFRGTLSVIDVGGGFPAAYLSVEPPPLETYFKAIGAAYKALNMPPECELWCEPGRALVAAGASLVVKIELRRGNKLYLNDGMFGSLSDLQYPAFTPPMRGIRPDGPLSDSLDVFSFYGPTCDSEDVMKGPYLLPSDIGEGDWLEVGQWGAYSTALRTHFNGFYADQFVAVKDDPFLPMHTAVAAE